jgi:hypothetical protein
MVWNQARFATAARSRSTAVASRANSATFTISSLPTPGPAPSQPNSIEQLARLGRLDHWGLADFDHTLRPVHGCGRVGWHHVAGDKPVKQHAHSGDMPLDAWSVVGGLKLLSISRNIE